MLVAPPPGQMRNVSPRAHHIPAHASTAGAHPGETRSGVSRNMTGIYLGTDEGNAYPRARNIIPPLARCRALNKRARTPTEERRYKLVELLRYKEERRGFSGNPVKLTIVKTYTSVPAVGPTHFQVLLRAASSNRRSATTKVESTSIAPVATVQREDVTIWDITRQTQRHFTAATNSGMTHLEYLSSPDADGSVTSFDRDVFTMPLSVAQEVHRAVSGRQNSGAQGLTECYKTVCKNNVESLQHLLPGRAPRGATPTPRGGNQNYRYTGFTVKSYRNPNQAEIAATFDPPEPRPRTVSGRGQTPGGGVASGGRPFVPSPYFYKTYTSPGSRSGQMQGGSPRQGYAEPLSPLQGAGVLPRSLTRSRPNTSVSSQEGLQGNAYGATKVPPAVPRSTPAPKSAKSVTDSEGDPTEGSIGVEPSVDISVPGTGNDDQPEQEPSAVAMSGTGIVIGLEDEQGEQRPVEIDEADELLAADSQGEEEDRQPKRRVSITDRVLRNKNCELQMKHIEETANTRKNELAELLNEHAQIVQEVVTMVKSSSERSLAGKENSVEPPEEGATDETPDE